MDSMKEWFDSTFYRDLAQALAARVAGFDSEAFQREAGAGLAALELKARLWRTVELCRKYLPADYRQAVEILREVAPRYDGEFKGMFCPEFVGCYGLKDYDYSMEALKYFTPFSTSESAVRPFLRQDLQRGLAYMQRWSMDADEHDRLASEGRASPGTRRGGAPISCASLGRAET
jgi:hypothetical protein